MAVRLTFFRRYIALLFLSFCSTLPAALHGAVPTTFTYQGSLKQNGVVVNGNQSMEFRLTNAAGSQLYWTSGVQTIAVREGLYRAELAPTGINWATADPHIEIKLGGTVLMPRERLSSAVYSLMAKGMDAAATAKGDLTVAGKMGVGAASPIEALGVTGRARIDGPIGNGLATNDDRYRGALRVVGTADRSAGRLMVLQAPWDATFQNDRLFLVGYDANGNSRFAIRGDGALLSSSSRRLKENIVPVTGATALLSRLNGVRYKWKGETANAPAIGFIAEELATVVPEAVEKGELVNYAALVPLLVESIKELRARLETLESAKK